MNIENKLLLFFTSVRMNNNFISFSQNMNPNFSLDNIVFLVFLREKNQDNLPDYQFEKIENETPCKNSYKSNELTEVQSLNEHCLTLLVSKMRASSFNWLIL